MKDLPQTHKSHRGTTFWEEVEQLYLLSTLNIQPCIWVKLSSIFKLEGITNSPPTIQTILIKHGMAIRYEKLLKLEEKTSQQVLELTATTSGAKFYESIVTLQTDLDLWLKHCNTGSLHQGYKNISRDPVDIVLRFVKKTIKKLSNTIIQFSKFSASHISWKNIPRHLINSILLS